MNASPSRSSTKYPALPAPPPDSPPSSAPLWLRLPGASSSSQGRELLHAHYISTLEALYCILKT